MTEGVLLLEAHAGVANALAEVLHELAGRVDRAGDGVTAVAMARACDYGLIVLDPMAPVVGGRELCAQLRSAAPDCPLLAVTARSDMIAPMLGVRDGFDDYALKPLDLVEVREKARLLLGRPRRWRAPAVPGGRWTSGAVSFDLAACRVAILGRPVEGMSAAEFDVLHFLARHPGKSFPARELIARLWGLHQPIKMRTLGVNFFKLKGRLAGAGASCLVVTSDERYMFLSPRLRSDQAHGEQARVHSPA